MAELRSFARSPIDAGFVLGSKLDSIPFSPYHLVIIFVLGSRRLVDGYDLAMTGSLLVLAKAPLHLTGRDPLARRRLDLMLCVGGFTASAISDHWSRRTGHADRGGRHQLFHLADPAGAKRRAADHHSPVDRSRRRRLCRVGAVPDRRRIDAGAAPAHLWRDLRDDAGQLVHLGAVGRLSGCRQSERFPVCALPAVLGLFVVPVLVYFADSGEPALAFARRANHRPRSPSSTGSSAGAAIAWRR